MKFIYLISFGACVMFPFIVSTLAGGFFCSSLSIGLEKKENFIKYLTYLNEMVSID